MEKLANLDLSDDLKKEIVNMVNSYNNGTFDDDTFENEYNNLIAKNHNQEDEINKAFEILFESVESSEASMKKKKKKKHSSKSKRKGFYSSPIKTSKKTTLKLAKSVKSSRPTRSSSSRRKTQNPWWKLF